MVIHMRNNRISMDSSFDIKKDNHYTYYKNRFYSNDQNFYINLFSIALLMDLDNDSDKDIYILYNHNNKYYFAILDNRDKEIKQDFDSIVTNFFNVESSLLKVIGNDDKEHNNILYDPMRMIVRISYETFLMLDKILRLDFDHDYDNIIEAINKMQLRAQEKVLNKIREFIHEKQDISNLLKTIISPIEKFMDDSFFYKYERTINKKQYIDYIVNYNTQYQYFYIDNLLYMALYYRYMTLFQLNPFNPNITYEKYERLTYKYLMSSLGSIPFQHNKIFNCIMDISDKRKEKWFEENFNENTATIYNGLRIYSERQYRFSNHKWIANNICIESQLSNSIQNLYNSIFNINNYIITVNKEARLSLYTPSFENLSKKKFKSKLSRALHNLNYIDYLGRNTNSNRPKSNTINKDTTYGELLLGAAIDTTGNFFNHTPGYHGKQVDYNMGFSPFQGYMQSNSHVILNNMHNQYHSSIWLRPLYQDQLYNVGIMQNHLAPYNLVKTKNKILYNNYDDYNNNNSIHRSIEDLYYISYNNKYNYNNAYPNILYTKTLINTSQSLPYYYLNNSNDYNYTYYQLSLASTILIRLYMIGILTTIAKVKNYESLVISDEDYIKEYFEIINDANSLESLYNNFKKCCIIKIKDIINNEYDIKCLQRMFIFKITNAYYNTNPFTLKNNYYNKQFFYETFELYVNDAMRVNKETLLRIKDIATEDIISCPVF